MSNIDKRALREAAEKAGSDEWCAFIDTKSKTYSVHTPGDNRCGDVVKWAGFDGQQRAAAKAQFIAAANPATVLALLDELEAKGKQIDILRQDKDTVIDTSLERINKILSRAEAAEKRIAELETREVKLPNPHAHLIWIQAGHAPDDYWDDVAVSHSEKDKCCDGSDRYPVYALWEIKEALSDIGINIAAAGKGGAS